LQFYSCYGLCWWHCACESQYLLTHFITNTLHIHFKLKDLGNLKFFIGLELSRSKHGIFMCQNHYVLSILADCGMVGCKPYSISMMPNAKLHSNPGDPSPEPNIYKGLIG